MSLLKPFSKLPGLNKANILVNGPLVENEEQFQQKLADTVLQEKNVNVLAGSLPLPMENEESRPRIDLVVFIIHLTSELSFQSAETSLKYLDPGYFQGKVCFLVTNARNVSVPPERLVSVRKLAASLHCPLLCTEDQPVLDLSTVKRPCLVGYDNNHPSHCLFTPLSSRRRDNRGGNHSSTPITGHSQGSGRSCPHGNWALPVHLDPLHCAL